MKNRAKSRRGSTSSIRRSVAIPPQLVELAQRGGEAETAGRDNLKATHNRFMSAADPERKGEAGKDLIRTIFGKDAIAEDSIL
jgi:hypothetical protein